MYTREEYLERTKGKISDNFGKRVGPGKNRSLSKGLPDPHHPLVGATPRERIQFQIEQLELRKTEARQSGVRGENLVRWLAKLDRKIEQKKALLG